MMLISHRGNLNGPQPELENSPRYIQAALDAGYSVEVDLWVIDDIPYLGHDKSQYPVYMEWLKERQTKLWIHCKNRAALEFCLDNKLHCFYHDKDDYTMTNCGYVWAFPGQPKAGPFTIMVLPEWYNSPSEIKELDCFGICSDYVELIKHLNKP